MGCEANAIGTRGLLAVTPHQRGPAAVGLLARDLLLEHRGHERLDQCTAAADAGAPIPPVGSPDDLVMGHESGVVVVEAEHRGGVAQGRGRPRPPRRDRDVPGAGLETKRGRTLAGAHGGVTT